MPKLVLPDIKYKNSYLKAVREYKADTENIQRLETYQKIHTKEISQNFDQYVDRIRQEAQGIGLPLGYVPHTVYWLVDGDEFLGRVDIRHTLTKFLKNEGGHIGYDIRPSQRKKGYGNLILKLAIQKAKDLGIHPILVTADTHNIASNRIILQNNGVFKNTHTNAIGLVRNRYWISAT
jgi:predicted acetyltransferase